MELQEIVGKEEYDKVDHNRRSSLHRLHQFYCRVVDLAEANHVTAARLVEENGRLENENEGLRDLCQELLSDMADLEKECSEFRRKVRSAVLELTPHQKENKHD
jgi:predicted RNase H-like nuclease (RuvC/YqgF family)